MTTPEKFTAIKAKFLSYLDNNPEAGPEDFIALCYDVPFGKMPGKNTFKRWYKIAKERRKK